MSHEKVNIFLGNEDSPMAQLVKNCLQCRRDRRHGFNLCIRKIPWRRKWHPIPAFLPEKSRGQTGLEGYSTKGLKSQTQTCDYTHTHMQLWVMISATLSLTIMPCAVLYQSSLHLLHNFITCYLFYLSTLQSCFTCKWAISFFFWMYTTVGSLTLNLQPTAL